jgi:YD repeat-containing protein
VLVDLELTWPAGTPSKVTRYEYDHLGRVTRRWPSADSLAVRDSMVYDLAGNLVKVSTRRGHLITIDYDVRNRETQRVIPTVGTEVKTYTGPLDQLTSVEITGYIDSIGGLNPKRTWTYDQRGRRKTDVSYPLGAARTISYSYDTYERAYSITDPLGTWVTEYEANRGYPTKLKTPIGVIRHVVFPT